jgi:hypothetical protein
MRDVHVLAVENSEAHAPNPNAPHASGVHSHIVHSQGVHGRELHDRNGREEPGTNRAPIAPSAFAGIPFIFLSPSTGPLHTVTPSQLVPALAFLTALDRAPLQFVNLGAAASDAAVAALLPPSPAAPASSLMSPASPPLPVASPLRYLHAANAPRFTDASASLLSLRAPLLTILSLAWCDALTDCSLVSLARGCPRLTSADLSGCRRITDKGVAALCGYGGGGQHGEGGGGVRGRRAGGWHSGGDRLSCAEWGWHSPIGCSSRAGARGADADIRAATAAILAHASTMRTAQGNSIDAVGEADGGGCTRLQRLVLRWIASLGDASAAAAAVLPELLYLDLSGAAVTDTALRHVARGCPALRALAVGADAPRPRGARMLAPPSPMHPS